MESSNGAPTKAPKLTDAHRAIFQLRKAVWVAGQDGSKAINWEKVPEAIRSAARRGWLASGWSVAEFDQGKDYGNSKRFCAGYEMDDG